MAGKLQFTLQEYKDAARKWRSDFLRLPIIGCDETLKFMTGRPGIRYKESVGTLNASAQFAPYSPTRSEDVNLQLDFRTLETFFGSVVAKFEPNSAISTLLGTGATKGDGQKSVPTAREVLGLIAKSLSEKSSMMLSGAVCATQAVLPPRIFSMASTPSQRRKLLPVLSLRRTAITSN
ncbi:hypothetical protein [Prevotella sp.]|uniref:hypothetical protein n=1 Tax=Prevotella sp. TaxID=59823 RepID=UPI0027E26446|nr:hypothetical protein [Prevotella sp.]